MRTALALAALLGVQDAGTPPKKRVLVLGDSISMGYTPFVREALRDDAAVVRPTLLGKDENCEGTAKGAKEVGRWLALEGGTWDAIRFNFGLHDLKRVDPNTGRNSDRPEAPRQSEPEAYEKPLRAIVAALRKTGAKRVFACTTPVPAGRVKPYRDPGDPPRYNAIARKVMGENAIPVNDLYAFALPRLREIQLPENVHFTREGSRLLAGEVVRHLREALGIK